MSAVPKGPSRLPDPQNLREVLGYWVRLHRANKGWSQERMALECGLDRTYVSGVERGQWNVSLGNLEIFANTLGVQAWSLLHPPPGSTTPSRPPK